MEIDDKKHNFDINKEDDKVKPDPDAPELPDDEDPADGSPDDVTPADDEKVTSKVVPELHLIDIPYVQALHNLVGRLLSEMSQTMTHQDPVQPEAIVEDESPFASEEGPAEPEPTPDEEEPVIEHESPATDEYESADLSQFPMSGKSSDTKSISDYEALLDHITQLITKAVQNALSQNRGGDNVTSEESSEDSGQLSDPPMSAEGDQHNNAPGFEDLNNLVTRLMGDVSKMVQSQVVAPPEDALDEGGTKEVYDPVKDDNPSETETPAVSAAAIAEEAPVQDEVIIVENAPVQDEVTIVTETPMPIASDEVTPVETPVESGMHTREFVFDGSVGEDEGKDINERVVRPTIGTASTDGTAPNNTSDRKYTARRDDYKRRSRAPITTVSSSASAILPWIWWTLAAIAAVIVVYFGYETYETYFADSITQSEIMIEDFTNDGLTENPFGDIFTQAADAEMMSDAIDAETVTDASGATDAEVISAPTNTNVSMPTGAPVSAPAADMSSQNATETPAISDEAAAAEETAQPSTAADGQMDEEVLKVIRGEYGSGPERYEMMRERGLDVEAIQARVNDLKNNGAF